MEQGPTLKKIDKAANMWNKTKDPQYKCTPVKDQGKIEA